MLFSIFTYLFSFINKWPFFYMKTVRINTDSFRNKVWKVPIIFFHLYSWRLSVCLLLSEMYLNWILGVLSVLYFWNTVSEHAESQDTLGTSLFLLMLSSVAPCIQISYKSRTPLWQVIARRWVEMILAWRKGKTSDIFLPGMVTERAEGIAGSCKSPTMLQLSHGDMVGELSFPPKIPKR